MKKLTLALALAFFSLISFSQRYAYVDTKYILENIPEYITAQKTLDDLSPYKSAGSTCEDGIISPFISNSSSV